MALPLFLPVVLIWATSGAIVVLASVKPPAALLVVVGSPGSQTPLPFRSKHTVAPAYTEATVLEPCEPAAVSANAGGVREAPPTVRVTMEMAAEADAEAAASTVATAAATSEGRRILDGDCIVRSLPEMDVLGGAATGEAEQA